MSALRIKLGRLLRSRRLAAWLFLFVFGYTALVTAIPQESLSPADIPHWRLAHPLAAALVSAMGLHRAFRSPIFLIPAALLVLSTALCAWDRSRAARLYFLPKAAVLQRLDSRLRRTPTVSVIVPADQAATALESVGERLRGLRLRVDVEDSTAFGHSSLFAALGSPLFHWALVGLFLAAGAGQLTKWEAWVEVPVGHAVTDGVANYSALQRSPLSPKQPASGYRIEVPSMDMDYSLRGIDRGFAPKVRLFQGATLAAESLVYPNRPLFRRGLYVHRQNWGLAAIVALDTTAGVEVGRRTFLFDIVSTKGTGRLRRLEDVPPETGVRKISLAIPLDPAPRGLFRGDLPKDARIELSVPDSTEATTALMRPGDSVALSPDGLRIRIVDVTRYVRLRLVQDSSILFVYLFFALSVVGSALALLVYPRMVLVSAEEEGAGTRVRVLVLTRRVDVLFKKRVVEALETLGTEDDESCS